MTNKKYRVKNTKTGNFVSEELNSTAATKLCGELTIISDWYEVVDAEETVEHKELSVIRKMTEEENELLFGGTTVTVETQPAQKEDEN